MTRLAPVGGFVAAVLCVARPLPAQLAEVQLGVVASYGSGDPYRTGGGLVFGIAPGGSPTRDCGGSIMWGPRAWG